MNLTPQYVAVMNAGSSSIKFAVFHADAAEPLLFRGLVENIGHAPRLMLVDATGRHVEEQSWPSSDIGHQAATNVILETALRILDGAPVAGVGHRVVHGGTAF